MVDDFAKYNQEIKSQLNKDGLGRLNLWKVGSSETCDR